MLHTKHFLIGYIGTKAEIEALSPVALGSRAVATDTDEGGFHNGLGWDWYSKAVYEDTKEPTGWLDPDATAAATTYDSATQKVTISGTHYYYWRGVKKSVTNFVSTAHTNTVGHDYYLFSADGDTFIWQTDIIWDWTDVMLAEVHYETAFKYGTAETHGLMPHEAHEEFHQTIGTYKQSGGLLSSYVLASTTAANVHDEDVEHVLAALTSKSYTQLTLLGANTTVLTTAQADIVPLLVNNPYYNSFTAPNWGQTLMANNSYMCVWLVAQPTTHDANSENYRFLWVQGQSNGTLVSQQNLSPLDVSLGEFSDDAAEFIFCAKVIIRFQGGNWDLTSVTALTGNRSVQVGSPSGVYLSTVAVNGSLTGDGTITSPLSASSGATTVTAAGNTALLVSSYTMQEFTGTTTQTVTLPVVSTLRLGHQFIIMNHSTGAVTVNSSGGNLVATVGAGNTLFVRCILITGTTAACWDADYVVRPTEYTGTGTGVIVRATSPTLVSPVLGVATATSVMGLTPAHVTDLTDAGDSVLHYHSADRSRAVHTGTQLAATISDFNTAASSAAPAETLTTIGALIGTAGDATPNDSDYVATALTLGGLLKKITWTNVKAFLKTHFDTLYNLYVHPNHTGEVTSVSDGATTIINSAVIGKVLTGYTSGAGTVVATDTILQAIQKLNGNDATNANLTGHVISVGNATSLGSFTVAQLSTAISDANISGNNSGDQTITLTGEATGSGTGSFSTTLTNSAVIGKILTGYVSGAGTVAATDTILQAFQKLNGNDLSPTNLAEAVSFLNGGTGTHTAMDSHIASTANPHSTTAAQVGVVAETNANDIFSVVAPGFTSVFAAKLNGNPTSVANSVCTFDTVTAGGVGVITPTSTSQLAKMRIRNITRGNSALILSATGATFTTTTNVYTTLGWRDNDDVTITSATVSGSGFGWVDMEITSVLTSKTSAFMRLSLSSTTIGDLMRIHPFTASYSTSKNDGISAIAANQTTNGFALVSLTSNIFALAWTGTPAQITIREAGYIT